MLERVDLADPSQKEMAAHITTKYAAAGRHSASEDDGDNSTAKFYRDDANQTLYDEQMLRVRTGMKLLQLDGLKTIVRPKYARLAFVSLFFCGALQVFSCTPSALIENQKQGVRRDHIIFAWGHCICKLSKD